MRKCDYKTRILPHIALLFKLTLIIFNFTMLSKYFKIFIYHIR